LSILANLLKKAETNQTKADIPPGLLQTVRTSADGSNDLKKYLLIGGLAVASLGIGGVLALYMGRGPAVRPPVAQQQLPQPAVSVQKPVSAVTPLPAPLQTAEVKQTVKTTTPQKTKSPSGKVHATHSVKHASALPSVPAPSQEKKAVVRDRATIDALLFSARSAEGRRDFAAALKQYQKALEADPYNYRIMNNVASSMLQLGMNDQALTIANRALSVKPDYPSAMVNAGIALGRLGHDSGARGMFSKALVQDPTNRNALFSLAVAQERAGLHDDALVSYRRLAAGGDVRGLLGQGRLYERRGATGEALGFYREVTASPEAGQKLKELARERIAVLER